MKDKIVCSIHDIEFVKCNDENSKMLSVTAACTGKWNDHPQGKFEINASDIDGMVEYQKLYGKDILFDYDHRSIDMFNNSSKAAGWGKVLINEDNKLKIEVDFTEEGYDAVKNGEYKYLSPVFLFPRNRKNSEPRVILHSVALTNIPFLKELCWHGRTTAR